VQLVTATRDNLSQIITNVDAASVTCDTIAASAKDQAAALVEINAAVSRMSQTTQHSAAMVEEASAAIAALADEASHLEQSAGRFQCTATGASHQNKRRAA
jgi:methyl-accepting chemotaxis protein